MIKIVGTTDPGRVRKENQDAFAYRLIGENSGYAIVCDGMGGEKAGDVASTTTCQLIAKFFTRDLAEGMGEAAVKSVILSAVCAANAKVHAMANESEDYCGMGTTLVLVVALDGQMHIVNIGDSRIYQVQGGKACQLTKDHTLVQSLIDKGEISPEEAICHPQRHYITRAVGVTDQLDIDYQLVNLEPDTAVLLCSDGLSSYLKLDTLEKRVLDCQNQNSTQSLVDFANNEGGQDNVTAVLLYQG